MKTANFRFHGNLNDFFPDPATQERPYRFQFRPSLKDAMESMGVPHVEVGRVLVNGMQRSPAGALDPGDQVDVHPFLPEYPAGEAPRFVADSHLGKLVKLFRLLGLDTLYNAAYPEKELVRASLADRRILLTRSVRLLKYAALQEGYLVRAEVPELQLRELQLRFGLKRHFRPFTRCLDCNGQILPVDKQEVLPEIPPLSAQYFGEFYRCSSCRKVYWKGSHYDRMLDFLRRLNYAI